MAKAHWCIARVVKDHAVLPATYVHERNEPCPPLPPRKKVVLVRQLQKDERLRLVPLHSSVH